MIAADVEFFGHCSRHIDRAPTLDESGDDGNVVGRGMRLAALPDRHSEIERIVMADWRCEWLPDRCPNALTQWRLE
jgi:hypothetical protein